MPCVQLPCARREPVQAAYQAASVNKNTTDHLPLWTLCCPPEIAIADCPLLTGAGSLELSGYCLGLQLGLLGFWLGLLELWVIG